MDAAQDYLAEHDVVVTWLKVQEIPYVVKVVVRNGTPRAALGFYSVPDAFRYREQFPND